jgi:hypothetical protein
MGSTLNDPDLVVQARYKAERNFILGFAEGGVPSQCRSIIAANFS